MNTFFTNIGKQLASKFEETRENEAQYISRVTPTMSELYLTSERTTEKLKKLNPKKATGHGNISTREIKLLSEDMTQCLFSIFRQGYPEGKFPTKWKIGKLKTAYKAGERTDRGNFRPLSMLPIPSKIFEAIICDQLDDQVDLTRQRNQWAYRKNTSTKSMSLYLSEVWKKAINNGQTVGVKFIDCSKAFDSIVYHILEQKIEGIGITGQLYNLIESYLEERQQYTEVNRTASELKETPKITYGLLIRGTSTKNLMEKIEIQHIKAARIVKKIGIKVNDTEILQRVSWNRIDYIYKRKIVTEIHKLLKETEGHRIRAFEKKSAKEEVFNYKLRD